MNTTVKNLFKSVCEVYNLRTRENVTLRQDNPTQKDYYSHDFVKMDYTPQYGGYVIMVVNAGTSQKDFDGYTRRSAKEMIAYLRGLLAAKNEYIYEGIIN
jgi:hypothetical protein